jgi:hypothetical protein
MRIASALVWTAIIFVGLWYCPYGMPHDASIGAYIAFAALTFTATWFISIAVWATTHAKDSAYPEDESTWGNPCWNCGHVPGCEWQNGMGYACCPECFAD